MRAVCLPLSLVLLLGLGCFLPKGQPVFVKKAAVDSWNGHGVLLAVSEDQTRCQVALRSRALVVEKHWVACNQVREPLPR